MHEQGGNQKHQAPSAALTSCYMHTGCIGSQWLCMLHSFDSIVASSSSSGAYVSVWSHCCTARQKVTCSKVTFEGICSDVTTKVAAAADVHLDAQPDVSLLGCRDLVTCTMTRAYPIAWLGHPSFLIGPA